MASISARESPWMMALGIAHSSFSPARTHSITPATLAMTGFCRSLPHRPPGSDVSPLSPAAVSARDRPLRSRFRGPDSGPDASRLMGRAFGANASVSGGRMAPRRSMTVTNAAIRRIGESATNRAATPRRLCARGDWPIIVPYFTSRGGEVVLSRTRTIPIRMGSSGSWVSGRSSVCTVADGGGFLNHYDAQSRQHVHCQIRQFDDPAVGEP